MLLHANAKLGLAGRLALVLAIEDGCSPATAHQWWHRLARGGRARQSWSQTLIMLNETGPHRKAENVNLLEAAQALALDAATGAVVRALRARGIDCLLLRGPAIARRLYPGGGRSYVDADLLIEPRRFADAEAALTELGFREAAIEAALPAARPGHAHTWLATNGRVVDLHRTLIGTNAPPDQLWVALRDGAESLALELIRGHLGLLRNHRSGCQC
jgi:Uncharacterised nucleotidyltransferase